MASETAVAAQQMAAFIQDHGSDAWVNPDGSIGVVHEYRHANGALESQTESIPARWSSVRNWLGY